jgi:hypothetical protein
VASYDRKTEGQQARGHGDSRAGRVVPTPQGPTRGHADRLLRGVQERSIESRSRTGCGRESHLLGLGPLGAKAFQPGA